MNKQIEERVLRAADYILKKQKTLEEVAELENVSIYTIKLDISSRLQELVEKGIIEKDVPEKIQETLRNLSRISPELKARTFRAIRLLKKGKSIREIAEIENVSHETIRNDLIERGKALMELSRISKKQYQEILDLITKNKSYNRIKAQRRWARKYGLTLEEYEKFKKERPYKIAETILQSNLSITKIAEKFQLNPTQLYLELKHLPDDLYKQVKTKIQTNYKQNQIDPEQIEEMQKEGKTLKEIADFFDCSVMTINRILAKQRTFNMFGLEIFITKKSIEDFKRFGYKNHKEIKKFLKTFLLPFKEVIQEKEYITLNGELNVICKIKNKKISIQKITN